MARLGMRFDRDTVHPTRGVALRVYRLTRAEWENHGQRSRPAPCECTGSRPQRKWRSISLA